jgi:hypothetical protein
MSDFHPNAKGGFIENTLEGLHFALQRALYAEVSPHRAPACCSGSIRG